MSLLNLLPAIVTKSKKRIGRGIGSGMGGHTVGRGQKGYKSRVGSKVPLWFEGGQLPLIKRLPMQRGKGKFKVIDPTAEISLTALNRMQAEIVTLESLKLEKVIDKRFHKAKIVASGKLERPVTIKGIGVSEAAQAAIAQAGGQIVE